MSFNIVDIKVVTDYTDFSNTVRFQLNVPVTASDAEAVNKALGAGPWSDVASAITSAAQAGAPKPVQDLVTQLLTAYAGAAPSGSSGGDTGGGSGGESGGDTGGAG